MTVMVAANLFEPAVRPLGAASEAFEVLPLSSERRLSSSLDENVSIDIYLL